MRTMIPLIFLLTATLTIYLFSRITNSKWITIYWISWAVALSVLSLLGLFERLPPLFATALAGTATCVMVSWRNMKPSTTPKQQLYGIHAIRIIVEIVLVELYKQEKVPRIMTLEGWNLDIVFGVSALVIWYIWGVKGITLPKKVWLSWNILGLSSVLWVLLIGILSSPLPLQQLAFQMPNVAVLSFPYSLLPTIVVPLIVLTHLIEIKRLTTHK